MSRVWVLTAEYEPFIIGGLGTVATNLTKAFARKGVSVTVFSFSPAHKISVARKNNIKIIRFPKHYSIKKITSYISSKKLNFPRAIHVHSLQLTELALHFKKKYGIPIIYTSHSLVTKNNSNRVFTQGRQRQLLKSARRVVVPSKSEYSKIVYKYPFCAKKLTVIPHGVNVSRGFSKASKYRLLFVGRIVRNKGIPQLIDAMRILTKTFPKAKLYIIGKGSYKGVYKKQVKRYQFTSRVQWLGYYNQMKLQKKYKQFGAVVMPSNKESFGLVALETLANGVPLVSTRAGGLRQFVNGRVAQVIPKVSGVSIAKSIASMWKSPALTRKRMLAGKKVALTYKWSKAAQSYTRLFFKY